ncbi:diphthine--ammonia ligase [Hymenobacter sp. BT770]|uniref:Dph6-related ATP pyrophosphatase n=1 Tax=Hymenobacter sp. BT770 TaxID=2886942 RepID=UPI001D10E51B|nr:diphthine--ammonia ligase [Hymenobacter sp. BT770]MCC3152156.1 diphthine--ammonia ligase [Hymenobacter sp. BT770]MDO3415162.1 diphthine--ammonia ligase [Hymenobacter sp. BT770]
MKEQAIFNWSGGKDSALALYKVLQGEQYDVLELLTTVSEPYQRISMHGVRVALLEQQAASLGLPCRQLLLPEMPTMEAYEQLMTATLGDLQRRGATASIFGDIFLEDLRRYREDQLARFNLKAVFPLWGQPTAALIREFIGLGFKTITTCVNEKYLDQSFVGRVIDEEFLRDLPTNVDPCGENGEFHTFVYDGPMFRQPVAFERGEVVYRKYTPAPKTDDSGYDCADDSAGPSPFDTGFWYCDLV